MENERLKCEHCGDPIETPMEFRWKGKNYLINACDKDCAHDIKNIDDLFIELGITPEEEEEEEKIPEVPNLGFVK